MRRLRLENCYKHFELHECTIVRCYMWLELCVWSFMTYASIYHGKMFDYEHCETRDFVAHVEGGNWYYRLMFGDLTNLSNIDVELQRSVQVKCDTLNTLFVFAFGTYFVLSILFLIGMSKKFFSKFLILPYVSFNFSVLTSVAVFCIYGACKHIAILDHNGSFFLLVKLGPTLMICSYYRSLVE